ncbi:Nuclear transport factor 2 [Hordeum vulgare]|nr:Nuclear transport factor 2 [Hordeum vulgare]
MPHAARCAFGRQNRSVKAFQNATRRLRRPLSLKKIRKASANPNLTGGGGGGAEMDPDSVAKAFVEHYYRTFDTNRAALVGLYQEGSMLSFEGEKFLGAAAIATKLTSLPFEKCAHTVVTVDCQPAGPTGGMLVFVSGSLQAGDGEHHIKFSQMFHLMPLGPGNFYVHNDMFRLNYG